MHPAIYIFIIHVQSLFTCAQKRLKLGLARSVGYKQVIGYEQVSGLYMALCGSDVEKPQVLGNKFFYHSCPYPYLLALLPIPWEFLETLYLLIDV